MVDTDPGHLGLTSLLPSLNLMEGSKVLRNIMEKRMWADLGLFTAKEGTFCCLASEVCIVASSEFEGSEDDGASCL